MFDMKTTENRCEGEKRLNFLDFIWDEQNIVKVKNMRGAF